MASAVAVAGAGWAISAASWIVSPVMSKLVNNAYSYLEFDASQKLQDMEATDIPQLRLMLQAADRSPHRALLERWMRKLKSAYYDVEDILDVADYDHLKKQVITKTSIDLGFPGLTKRGMKKRLENLENVIKEGGKLLPLFNLQINSCDANNNSLHLSAGNKQTTSVPPQEVFGRDNEITMIKYFLRETAKHGEPSSSSSPCYSVIGIHGIPGSGKTTVAQCVCDSEKNENYFHPIMWIDVSQKFSLHTIFKEMFEAASEEPCPEFSNLDILQRQLESKLRGKRFLLILDDIWCDKGEREQELDQILTPLRVGKRGSKILVTTRTEDAARALGTMILIRLVELDEEEFFKLFMHYATNGARFNDQQKETFEMIGRQIIKKIKRSPLVAKLVARSLSKKLDANMWRSARDQDLLTDMGALWWCYLHLDEHVRRCFAYCSIFPRRHLLKRDELINLWMAEGFLKTTKEEEQMEDIGEGYFDELVSSSFLQLTVRVDYSGTVSVCFTIHDLLHDLAERVAGSDCYTIVNEDEIEKVSPDVRHLFINCCDPMRITKQICRLKKLRTLIFSDFGTGLTEKVFEVMLKNLRKLRVLKGSLQGKEMMIPSSVGHLKHLRFFSIDGYERSDVTLPSSFDRLYHLQTLELPPHDRLICSNVKNISNLIRLRHIRTYSPLEFPGIGKLRSLRALDHFRVREEEGYELRQLKMLKRLSGTMRISGLENVKSKEAKEEAQEASLASKEYLSGLALEWKTEGQICPPDLQAEVLEGLRPPSQITRLEIKGYSNRRYSTWFLPNHNNLRSLQCLELQDCNQLKALPEIGELCINLRELKITSLPMLKELPRIPKNLKTLQITSCPSLVLTCMEDAENIRSMFYERVCQVGVEAPSNSTDSEEIYGLSRAQFDYFKTIVFGGNACTLTSLHFKYLVDMLGSITSVIDYPQAPSGITGFTQFPTGTDLFPTKYPRNYCETSAFQMRPQLLLPRSVEHLVIHFCTITDTALKNCLRGCCTSLVSLDLCGIFCLIAIPSEVMKILTKLRKLLINFCVNLTLLHGLNHLSVLEELTVRQCPNLTMTRQDSEKVRDLRLLTIDDISLVPELLSAEGCSSLMDLRVKCSEERKEAEFLQQLTSLNHLEFDFCNWDTLPDDLMHLKMLETLVITDCKKMRSLPTLPESLRLFHLDSCDQHFMDSCRTIGNPNWQKIAHVPYKVIQDIWYGFTNLRASLTQGKL